MIDSSMWISCEEMILYMCLLESVYLVAGNTKTTKKKVSIESVIY